MSDEIWWYLTRSSAMLAWALAMGSIVLGLLLSSKVMGRRPGFPWLLDLHRFTSGLSVAFVVVHLFSLWMHDYIEFTIADLLVPGSSSWRPGAVAFGIVAFWTMLVVQASSLLKRRLPKRAWHGLHLLSYLVAITGTVHGVMAGTDRANLFVQLFGVILTSLVVGLTAARMGAFNLAKKQRAKRRASLARVRSSTEGTAAPADSAAPRSDGRRSLADRHAELVAGRSS